MRIRKVKNSSGNIAVQVGFYKAKYFKLQKHIGTAKSDSDLKRLICVAEEYISIYEPKLIPDVEQKTSLNSKLTPLGYTRSKAYEYLKEAYESIFQNLRNDQVFKDVVIARLVKPSSKAESIKLLKKYFGITYSYTSVIRFLKTLKKDTFTAELLNYAQIKEKSTLFYDVTTLYFYSEEDEALRKPGYSKDGKFRYPQILFGLVVDKNGFPVFYDIFKGNTFEGHTMVPLIKQIRQKLGLRKMVVVADAGMISEENIQALKAERIDYIVGGRRTKGFFAKFENAIKKAKKNTSKTSRVRMIDDSYLLVNYSDKRYKKDIYEIKKATTKALQSISRGSYKRKSKFIKVENESAQLNQEQIEKSKQLAGIKVYRTSLKTNSKVLIDRYKDLWKVERSFRMSKSDLKTRPIFHREEKMIRSHMQVCVAALAISRLIEQREGRSTKTVVAELMDEIEVKFLDTLTKQVISISVLPHSFG